MINEKRSIYTNIFYVTIAIIIAVVIAMIFIGCSKKDYSYLNTDRRPFVIIISERYTNPPLTWKPYKIVYDSLSPDIDAKAYENQKPDTIFSTCSIDKKDSLFKVEIRKFKIVKP